MTSVRQHLHPFRHISIPPHQVPNGQRSFGMLGNNAFEDGDFLADHSQIVLRRPERCPKRFPSGNHAPGQHYATGGFVTSHFINIPAGVAGVN